MFDDFNNILKRLRVVSDASRVTLKSMARTDAIGEAVTDPDVSGMREGSKGLNRHRVVNTHPLVVDLSSPYPSYPEVDNTHMQRASQQSSDRAMVAALQQGLVDVAASLEWLQMVSERPDVKGKLGKDDEVRVARSLQQAGASDNKAARVILEHDCFNVLRTIIPEAFVEPEGRLKKAIAGKIFSHIDDGRIKPESIVTLASTSTGISSAVFNTVMEKGSKVVLPVPYFDAFPILLNHAGHEVVTVDTTKTHFKLKAEDLSAVLQKNGMGKGDWLFLTSPNNANMEPYTKDELQAIADVVAKSGIRVMSDELYAKVGNPKHESLVNFTSYTAQGAVNMRDKVITVSGVSKQYPHGSDTKRKLGVAYIPDPEEAKRVTSYMRFMHKKTSPELADMHASIIESFPERIRVQMRERMASDGARLEECLHQVNKKATATLGAPLFTSHRGEGSYFATLALTPEASKKLGAKDGDDLMGYLVATTGIYAKSLSSEGVKEPMVRVNTRQFAKKGKDICLRLDQLVDAIAAGKAPSMHEVNVSLNEMIKQTPGLSSEHLKQAQR